MECHNCELKQRQFYCNSCLKQHLTAFRVQYNHLTADRDAHIATAQRSLASVIEPSRLRRADLKGKEDIVREIWEGLETVRKANEISRQRIRALRETLSSRRRILAVASSITPYSYSHSSSTSTSASASPPPISTSPQSLRPLQTRRMSTTSSHTPSPGPRPPIVASRSTSTAGTPTPTLTQPFPSTSPQLSRPPFTTVSTPPLTTTLHRHTPSQPGIHGYSYQHRRVSSNLEKGPDPSLGRQIEEASYYLTTLSDTLARARSGLVQELVEVFSVVEVGGRPPLGGKAGTKGEWTIGGLVLPVPGDMRRYPPDHINAVLTHTLHFLSLLAFYLGIKLPFDVMWSRSSTPPLPFSSPSGSSLSVKSNGLLGVGTPWIGAIRGGENGGWARWSTKHPLHVSSTPVPSTASSPPTTSPKAPSSHRTSALSSRPQYPHRSVSSPATPMSPTAMKFTASSSTLADSHYEESPSSTSASGSSFTTALSMLIYDVCYLAHTQAVEIPLAQAGEVLGNLWAVCCSPELGRKSHATHPLLPAPTPSNFPLDFAQLLQATAANPSRARARGIGGAAVRERTKSERERDKIVEEEEGWDLVDIDG